jgi:hypothetical protein
MKKKGILSLALVLALALSLVPAAWADSKKADDEGKAATISAADVVINDIGETLYNDGDTVVNNFGTVYNNGGVVFNNGGVVFNNSGTVYNNGGVVYNNGAVVYNNDGTVYNNDGEVEDNAAVAADNAEADAEDADEAESKSDEKADDKSDKDSKKTEDTDAEAESETDAEEAAVEDEEDDGVYSITLAADYSALADFNGFDTDEDGNLSVTAKSVCTIAPHVGITITNATSTTGACTIDSDGVVTFQRAERDGKITLKFKVDAPVITPESATYVDDVEVSIIAADGTDIYYTIDGSEPSTKSKKYTGSFELGGSTIVRAFATISGATKSDVTEVSYIYPAIADIDFGTSKVGYEQPKAKALVVKNTGLGELVVESVKLKGDDKSSFTLSTTDGGTVASGQSNNKTWTIVPKKGLAAGEYEAEVEFTFDSGETLDVEVSFTVKNASAKAA